MLEFAGGEMAQVSFGRYHRGAWGEASRFLPQPGFQVFAERGVAWLEMPDRIQWTDASGTHDERLPMEPTVGEVLNEHFHRLVRGDQSLAPTIDDALAVARLVGELRRSRREGRKIALGAGHTG
jgi:predicted dehydrogenase